LCEPETFAGMGRKDSSVPCFGDALRMFALHGGIEVMMPEMVFYEATRRNANGFNLSDCFADKGHADEDKIAFFNKSYAFLEGLRERNVLTVVPYCKEIDLKSSPGGNSDDEAMNHREFMRKVHIVKDLVGSSTDTNDHRAKAARQEAMKLMATNTFQYGDDSLVELVSALPKSYSKPIICFSSDKELAGKLRKARTDLAKNIIALDTKGFLRGIHRNDLSRAAGLNLDIATAEDTIDSIKKTVHAIFHPGIEYHPARFIDSRNPCVGGTIVNDFTFEHIVAALKQRICDSISEKAVAPQGAVAEEAHEARPADPDRAAARLAKWKEKFELQKKRNKHEDAPNGDNPPGDGGDDNIGGSLGGGMSGR
jgi:hypothetical protein